MTVQSGAVQDYYPDAFAHCFGCGRLNAPGYHVRTFWEGDGSVARFTPRPEHVAVPGFVYGGLIASLIDCHAIGTAAAAAEESAGRRIGDQPSPRYVTAALHVDFLAPTPLGPELELRGSITSVSARKVVVAVSVMAAGKTTARGEVVAVPMPETMQQAG
ncbi:MAG TPA: PaaI family thioesterase [Vicinamibacterales bacterium]|nr:PaaI family thioesterase [Vicinamibacterales bacterium]